MGLVLASASPRRQELLRAAGIAITVQPTNIPETPKDGEAPTAFAERLAREKAWAVFKDRPNDLVLGADTVVGGGGGARGGRGGGGGGTPGVGGPGGGAGGGGG